VKVLLIGHSRIARRRVLPALRALKCTTSSASHRERRARRMSHRPRALRRLRGAIATSGADLAYVSLANGDHAAMGGALPASRPARGGRQARVPHARDARALVELAASQRRCLAEATVFTFHPQVGALLDAFAADDGPLRATAAFSFPPLPDATIATAGSWAAAPSTTSAPMSPRPAGFLFGAPPRSVACAVVNRNPDGVETAFSVLLAYDAHRSLAGHFGFDTAYQNRLLAFGRGVSSR
jgi:predicted dehydrogenase